MIDILKEKLYEIIDEHGLDSIEALRASEALDYEIVNQMKLIQSKKDD
ncbi:Spo0E family sporulation regulatory protein-aspartic acid phosphatase [Clostridium sardiniense]|uniref:Spo0E family sporulation regulatory protein-aspartic acid phosphatase n=1 Tax=Clostridium sardiniense TaxID=29369 RepID=A0ABS7KT15_CLOSR|nr:Spo0E family sporulation regulatory protein-aspartic acid phosphatase [Clostridium sardiniense]MBY0753944.1 Spo0E family sporulation regulatory protein-aspartic acid phosphatase [Clostridium sardiniense]MDQ0459540.1 hypothetical protein [Clostridium sardiniense]